MSFGFLAGYVTGARRSARVAAASMAADSFRSLSGAAKEAALAERIDRLTLVIEAMWSLLKESGLDDEALIARIDELDAADGTSDGRHTPKSRPCRACGAAVGPALDHCQFCGAAAEGPSSPFAGV